MESRTLGVLKRLLTPLVLVTALFAVSDIAARLLWNFGPGDNAGNGMHMFRQGDLFLCEQYRSYDSFSWPYYSLAGHPASSSCSQFRYHGWASYHPHTLLGDFFLHVVGLALLVVALAVAGMVLYLAAELVFLTCSWLHYVATGESLGVDFIEDWWCDSWLREQLNGRFPRVFPELNYYGDDSDKDDDVQDPPPATEWQTGPGLGTPPQYTVNGVHTPL